MKLKPCPFCGGEVDIVEYVYSPFNNVPELLNHVWWVVCRECGCKVNFGKPPTVYIKSEHVDNIIKVWNRREPIDKIVEQLKAEEYDINCNICDYDSEIDTNTFEYYEGKEDGIRSAIEIVKSGGTV